jgi:hypothetical protein
LKKLSLVVASLIASQTLLAEDTSATESKWSVNGNLRIAYIRDMSDSLKKDGVVLQDDAAFDDLTAGGWVTLTTPTVNSFSATATMLTSQPLFNINEDAWLTEKDGTSFSYMSEAYVTGQIFSSDCLLGTTNVILGKKVIDTPFANSDDIGMAPNSFEVYLVQSNPIENVTVTAGRVMSWAGHDAPTRGEFNDMTTGDGVSVFAINYANADLGVEAQAWNYFLDNAEGETDVNIAYVDGTYSTTAEGIDISVSGQYAQFQEVTDPDNNGDNDGYVIGGSLGLTMGALNLGFAYNAADGGFAPTVGYGSGPFYTSGDILTIASVGANAGEKSSAMAVTGGYQVTNELSVSAGFLTLSPDEGDDLTEIDFGASYTVNDNLTVDFYAEKWNSYAGSSMDETVDWFEYSVFANYSF